MGATDIEGRMATSLGDGAFVLPAFQTALDLPNAGVLLALPALLSIGLLEHTHPHFQLPKGFYGLDSLFLLLAFMALARLKSIESLRYCSPGEWGKILGLDRIPEARTLRDKIRLLTGDNQARQWSEELCQQWLQASPEEAGILYIDGHVRVYNGHQTQLPRHHVARQRLCLRATTDYWVNAMDGQPFFVVNQAVDPGLINVLEQDILPRLERDIPPPAGYQKSNPLSHRFSLVFDREGYSPDFLKRMKEKQVACLTYHKFPGDDWPEDEFTSHQVTAANRDVVEIKLAERGTCLSNKLWVREIRKLTQRGHQTSVLCTDYQSDLVPIATAMFARWSQENFFKYMREQYDLDRLTDYSVEDISEPISVVNPSYRTLDGQIRSLNGKLTRLLAQYGAMNLEESIEPEKVDTFVRRKAGLQEDIEHLQAKLTTLKENRKATAHHIAIKDLPKQEQFQKLSTRSKYLIDTIKMVAYRAETAMANILRKSMSHTDEARRLLQALYTSEADLIPDKENKTLTVCLHHMANHSSDKAIQTLCDELNETRTVFPQTELRLIFRLGSNLNP